MRTAPPPRVAKDPAAHAAAAEKTVRVRLHRIAHGRSGDKGNRQNISVIPYRPEAWPVVLSQVTEERVLDLFRHRGATSVTRYELPKLMALNFVVEDALEGGVNSALALDTHGKTAAFRLLSMEVEVPADLVDDFPRQPEREERQ
ncbi:Small uncharacterized protein [Lutibaculum baratangense AMV1]|uniref:Small uncharacterized protein n=1 Tax=Lutibaculum baratangense AMV1 TaxID=631454 RepID=V4TFI1_9HYPH|nr:Small uncharacterized protein [Lutibaculum baratangense AMV1]